MRRFQIYGDDNRLYVTMELGEKRIWSGCLLAIFTSVCVTVLGALAVIQGIPENGSATTNGWGYLNPRGNHFGFLWVVATLFLGILVPLYAAKIIRAKRIYLFDKVSGVFSHNKKSICEIRKIEGVKIIHRNDPDNRLLHKLVIVHTDGFEEALDNCYEEEEINYAAMAIGEFLRVPVNGIRNEIVSESILREIL